MALSYAGVPLVVATQEMALWVAANISTQDVYQFARKNWPGRNLKGLTFSQTIPNEPIAVGTLQWPQSAARWAVGHFLVTDNRLAAIRAVLGGGGTGTGATKGRLVMTEIDATTGNVVNTVNPLMFMLPPRPLSQLPNLPAPLRQLYLITLVDERFYWHLETTGHPGFNAGASWADVYDWLQKGLPDDTTIIQVDPVDPDYGRPDNHSELNRDWEDVALMLDATAFNCGQRICRDFDGVVSAQNIGTSQAILASNLAGPPPPAPKAGGLFNITDVANYLPEQVYVSFPQMCRGIPIKDFYTIKVDAAGLIPGGGNPVPGTVKQFRDLAWAKFGASPVPDNLFYLNKLAIKIARDYYSWNAYAVMDKKFNGLVPWDMEGLTDTVEWVYRLNDVSTRCQRGPWNGDPEELLHQLGQPTTTTGTGTTTTSGTGTTTTPNLEIDTTFPFWGILKKELGGGQYTWQFWAEYQGGYPDVGWDRHAGNFDGNLKDKSAIAQEQNLNTGLAGCIVLLYPGDDCMLHFDQCCTCACVGSCTWQWDPATCSMKQISSSCTTGCHCQWPSPAICPPNACYIWTGPCGAGAGTAFDNTDSGVLPITGCGCTSTTSTTSTSTSGTATTPFSG